MARKKAKKQSPANSEGTSPVSADDIPAPEAPASSDRTADTEQPPQADERETVNERQPDSSGAEDAPELPEDEEEAVPGSAQGTGEDGEKLPEYDFDREERSAKHKRIALITLSVILAAAVSAAILTAVVYNSAQDGRVIGNVYCSGINMGGKTSDEVKAALSSSLKLDSDTISISVPVGEAMTKKYLIRADEINMQGVVEQTAENVMNYARSGNIVNDALRRVSLLFRRHDVMCTVNYDKDKLALKLDEIGKDAFGQIIPHKIVVQADGNVALVAGANGFSENVEQALKDIDAALNSYKYRDIPVTMKPGKPEELKFENVDGAVYCDPVDAYYVKTDNTVSVVTDIPGRFLVREECEAPIAHFAETHEETVFPYHVSEAAVKGDDLQAKLFSDTIGSYSTSYGGGNRGANVAKAAQNMNGKVLLPGEVFSFNETVGPRTVAAGFKEAPEYVAGQSVMGIGGGTCQVSSTLYVAVLYAGLDIVSRTNHMMTVGYMPLGLDATVSYGGVDFKFRNSTNYPVKIVTSSSPGGGKITVSIVGTAYDPPITVKMTSDGPYYSNGKTSVRNYRNIYDADGNRIRQDNLGLSVYMPHSSE